MDHFWEQKKIFGKCSRNLSSCCCFSTFSFQIFFFLDFLLFAMVKTLHFPGQKQQQQKRKILFILIYYNVFSLLSSLHSFNSHSIVLVFFLSVNLIIMIIIIKFKNFSQESSHHIVKFLLFLSSETLKVCLCLVLVLKLTHDEYKINMKKAKTKRTKNK